MTGKEKKEGELEGQIKWGKVSYLSGGRGRQGDVVDGRGRETCVIEREGGRGWARRSGEASLEVEISDAMKTFRCYKIN